MIIVILIGVINNNPKEGSNICCSIWASALNSRLGPTSGTRQSKPKSYLCLRITSIIVFKGAVQNDSRVGFIWEDKYY